MSDSEEFVEKIIRTVAVYADEDPMNLPLLYDSIDPDSLWKVLSSVQDGVVTFSYAGYRVSVSNEQEILLRTVSS